MGMKRCGRGLGAWARGLAAAFVLLACLVAMPGRAQAAVVTSWDDLANAVSAGGDTAIEASGTLTAEKTIEVASGSVTVDFAEGSTVERNGSAATFVVKSGATLTVTGSVTVSGGTGSFVTVEAGGTLNVNGAITADGVNGSASFVDVAGTLSMGGSGVVKNWTTTNSSGDYSAINVHGADATFTMNGGEVSGNIVNAGSNSIEGGAIQLREGATFTMNGGSISGNNVYTGEKPSTVVQGGGVYASASTIEMGGGANVAAELTDTYWAEVSYEQILEWNPQVIIIVPEASYTKEDVLADAQLAEVDAVKNKQVYEMPSAFEAWDSPVPSAMLGSLWMAATAKLCSYIFA